LAKVTKKEAVPGLIHFRKNVFLPGKFYPMKIFLNDRTIEFFSDHPADPLPADLVVEYRSGAELKTAWEKFIRYEKFRHFRIIDPNLQTSKNGKNKSDAFKSFLSLFKVIQAAGGLVKNEKGEFLFIHRLGFWDLPKGKINRKSPAKRMNTNNDSESARSAAIREVKEETGLITVKIGDELPSTWHIYMKRDKFVLKRTRWFEMEADSRQALQPQISEGIFLVKWTPQAAIHCILTHTYASIRELLVNTLF